LFHLFEMINEENQNGKQTKKLNHGQRTFKNERAIST